MLHDDMAYAGTINKSAIQYAFRKTKPGITLASINEMIEWYIVNAGGKPAFKNYCPEGYPSPFPATACISPNDVVVHGIPDDYVVKNNDLLTIDVGTQFGEYFVDAARTFLITEQGYSLQHPLIEATQAVLESQLAVIKDGCSLLSIVKAAEKAAADHNVILMHQWGGHGIGKQIHMEPYIPNAIDRNRPLLTQRVEENVFANKYLKEGQTICLEPVVTTGNTEMYTSPDGWTVRKTDGNSVCHIEHCLVITGDGYEIIS